MIEVLTNEIKWETKNKIAFKEFNQGEEKIYLIAKRKKEKYRVRLGVLQINLGTLGSYSIKEILISFGFRRVGMVGISEQYPAEMRVKCPYCQTIQKLREERQQCINCNRKFYLFDDNW